MYNEFDKEEFAMDDEETITKKKGAFWAEDADPLEDDSNIDENAEEDKVDDDEEEEEEEIPPM